MLSTVDIVIVAIVVLAVAAMAGTAWWQVRQLRRRFDLEITNDGNVQSRYELRGDDPQHVLRFGFRLDGRHLPTRSVAASNHAPAPDMVQAAPARVPASGAISRPSVVDNAAAALRMSGRALPRALRVPLAQIAAWLRRGRRFQSLVSRWTPTVPQQDTVPDSTPSAAIPRETIAWAQVPPLRPGETLAIGLMVQLAKSATARDWPFRILSRSLDQKEAPLVIEEGSVHLGGGLWTRRYLPYAIVFFAALLLVQIAVWLANHNV